MENENKEKSIIHPKYLTCDQWVVKYGYPKLGGLRWMIFMAKNDPLMRSTFIRVGRRVLLDEEKFHEYLKLMNEKALEKERVGKCG